MTTPGGYPNSKRRRAKARSRGSARRWTRYVKGLRAVFQHGELPETPASSVEHPDFPLRLLKKENAAADPFPSSAAGELLIATIKTLAQALEAKDPYTAGHSFRVSSYSRALSRELGLSEDDVTQIGLAAELHDIGKIGVPERLLNKRSALLPSEYAKIMEHTVEGERILKPLFQTHPTVLNIVRSHHERVDGRGLPDRKPDSEIPLSAKIVSVADAFDAMTSARWYRPAKTIRFALDELQDKSGTQFDPECVRAFQATFSGKLSEERPSREECKVVYGRGRALGIASGW